MTLPDSHDSVTRGVPISRLRPPPPPTRGLCHECLASNALVHPHYVTGRPLCPECAESESRREWVH